MATPTNSSSNPRTEAGPSTPLKNASLRMTASRIETLTRKMLNSKCHATMTSVPWVTRELTRSGRELAASAGRMRTRLTPFKRASRQALSLGNIPPEMTADLAICSFDAGDVGEEDERVRLGGDGAGGGHLVGVDVVVLAVEAECDGGDDGHGVHLPDGFEPQRVGGGDLADEAEVWHGLLLAGAEDVAVAAGEPHGRLSALRERGD